MKLLKKFLPALSIFLLGALYYEASRWHLPKPESIGVKEHAAFAFLVVGLGYLFFAVLPKKLSTATHTLLISLLLALLVGNWWYYDFYHTYLTLGALSLAKYGNEISLSLSAFPFTKDTLILAFASIALLTLHHILFSTRQRKTYAALAILFIALGIGKESQVIGHYDGAYTSENKHPVLYLLREPFDTINKLSINETNYAAASTIFHQDMPEFLHGLPPSSQATGNFLSTGTAPQPRPYNVIILVMESFRASELGSYNPERSISPNFDQLAKSSTLYSRFYANSYQTSRGEMAILCSSMDYITGAPFSESKAPTPGPCMPATLAKNGYSTHWFHGYDTNFFNRKEFLPKVGFEHIHARDEIKPHARHADIGWGIQDIDVFDYTLSTLEKEQSPFFAEVMSLSNHFPFTWEWGIPFPREIGNAHSDDLYYNYQRGIHYTDYALGKFLERFNSSPLKDNTILIVTADHGLWVFPEESGKQTEASLLTRTDQYFRLPLLVKMPGQTQGKKDSRIASQLDIAPTVLSLLREPTQNTFLGHALNAPQSESSALMYAGGHYNYRSDHTMCYSLPEPGSHACDKKESTYSRCSSKAPSSTTPSCFQVAGDALLGDTLKNIRPLEDAAELQINLKKTVDLTQYVLKHGFDSLATPPTRLTKNISFHEERRFNAKN